MGVWEGGREGGREGRREGEREGGQPRPPGTHLPSGDCGEGGREGGRATKTPWDSSTIR